MSKIKNQPVIPIALGVDKPALPPRVWISVGRPEGYEDVHDDIVASDFLANPTGAWDVRLEHIEQILAEERAKVRAEIIGELREDAYRCTFPDYKGCMDKGWLYSTADHLESKAEREGGK